MVIRVRVAEGSKQRYTVLSQRLFATLRSPKYRTLFLTCYSAGLRISEACALRVTFVPATLIAKKNLHGPPPKRRPKQNLRGV